MLQRKKYVARSSNKVNFQAPSRRLTSPHEARQIDIPSCQSSCSPLPWLVANEVQFYGPEQMRYRECTYASVRSRQSLQRGRGLMRSSRTPAKRDILIAYIIGLQDQTADDIEDIVVQVPQCERQVGGTVRRHRVRCECTGSSQSGRKRSRLV